jgi:signal transduction histidine kinase
VLKVRVWLRRYGDLLIAAAFAAWMALDLVARPDGQQLLPVACGLVATLPLAFRRRAPVASFVVILAGLVGLAVVIPSSYAASAPFLAVSVWALFSLGVYAAGAQFWMSIVAVGFSIVLASLGEGSAFSAGTVMFFLAFVGTPWAAGVGLRLYRQRQAEEVTRTAKVLAAEAARSAEALEAERSRIARDLHDVVSHAMAVTLMQARGGRRMLSGDVDAARSAFDAIERTNVQALGDMRRMLNVLRDTGGEGAQAPLPSLRRLPQLIDQVRASGVPVDLSVAGDLDQVPPGVDLSTYRVIQEALTNVLKHAGPARAQVRVGCESDHLDLIVSDDGNGPTRDASGGHGLAGIRERVAVLGGEVTAAAGPLSGFVVRARLPYQVRS